MLSRSSNSEAIKSQNVKASDTQGDLRKEVDKGVQIMDQSVDMNQYIHATSYLPDDVTLKTWIFNIANKELLLSYTFGWHFVKYSGMFASKTGWYRIDKWYIRNSGNMIYTQILDINDWLKEHQMYLEDYKRKHQDLQHTIQILTVILGPTTFKCPYSTGWNITGQYTIVMDTMRFPDNISICFVDAKIDKTMSKTELVAFVKKNKKKISKIIEQEKVRRERKTKEIQNEIQKTITETRVGPSIKVVPTTVHRDFFIKTTLKERYEIQSCKKFPEDSEIENEIKEMAHINAYLSH